MKVHITVPHDCVNAFVKEIKRAHLGCEWEETLWNSVFSIFRISTYNLEDLDTIFKMLPVGSNISFDKSFLEEYVNSLIDEALSEVY